MARIIAKAAIKAATVAAKSPVANQKALVKKAVAAPKVEAPEVQEAADFSGKICIVNGGKKNVGEQVSAFFVPSKATRYGDFIALCEVEGSEKPLWFNVKHLDIVDDMDQADFDRLNGAREAEAVESLYIAATVGVQKDTAARLDYYRWAKNIWFPNTMLKKMDGALTADGTQIYEVPAWKIKKEAGIAAYEELAGQQADLDAIVNPPKKAAVKR